MIFESASASGGEGEYYSNARWYDPTLGRFLTEDPARDGDNWFAYCSNNPLAYIDPTGLLDAPLAMQSWGFGYDIPKIQSVETGNKAANMLLAGGAGAVNLVSGVTSFPLTMAGLGLSATNYLLDKTSQALIGTDFTVAMQNVATATPGLFQAIPLGLAMLSQTLKGSRAAAALFGAGEAADTEAAAAGGAGKAGASVWNLNPFSRGRVIEQALGANLPGNFPTIDVFKGGVATSIKSLDLGAASYQSASGLRSTIKGYIDSVAKFNGATWAGIDIKGSQITSRTLDLAIPSSGNAAQQKILQQMVQYGQKAGVDVNLKVVQ